MSPDDGYSGTTFRSETLRALNLVADRSEFGSREDFLRHWLGELAEEYECEAEVRAILRGEDDGA